MTRVYDQPVFGLFDARNVAVDEVLAVGMPPGNSLRKPIYGISSQAATLMAPRRSGGG